MWIGIDNVMTSGAAVSPEWWPQALSDASVLGYAGIAIGCVVALGLAVWRWRAAQQFSGPLVGDDGQAGSATVEFTLVFPIVMFLVLLLVQTTWAMVGNLYVHYAAFNATRSAIVYIPWHAPNVGEPHNTIRIGGGKKHDTIKRAAAFSLIPVAGDSESAEVDDQAVVDGLKAYYQKSGPDTPGWVASQAAGRVRYAMQHTEIELMRTNTNGQRATFDPIDDGRAEFGSREPITIQVKHDLNLAVPYVSVIFADGQHNTADGETGYSSITARYTLTNEGVSDALPEKPELPRVED
jgi:hypothetical protein